MNEPAQLTPPAIGEIWIGQGGVYGGLRQYAEGMCHIIFATEDIPGRLDYGDFGTDVDALSRIDGRLNTDALISIQGMHPAAIAAVGYSADGHSDFYLPAIGELNHGWQFSPDTFGTSWYYWSSTQRSIYYGYYFGFDTGGQSYNLKLSELLVRPARRFPQ